MEFAKKIQINTYAFIIYGLWRLPQEEFYYRFFIYKLWL